MARRHFSERGFARTTMRGVARDAGVDPALISHFFGSKQSLFAELVDLPLAPELIAIMARESPADAGRRMAEFAVEVLDGPRADILVSLVRAAASEPAAAEVIRRRLSDEVFTPLAEALGSDRPRLRATLCASQLVGLVVARRVVGVAALVDLPPDELAAAVGPVFQHYLTGPLTRAD